MHSRYVCACICTVMWWVQTQVPPFVTTTSTLFFFSFPASPRLCEGPLCVRIGKQRLPHPRYNGTSMKRVSFCRCNAASVRFSICFLFHVIEGVRQHWLYHEVGDLPKNAAVVEVMKEADWSPLMQLLWTSVFCPPWQLTLGGCFCCWHWTATTVNCEGSRLHLPQRVTGPWISFGVESEPVISSCQLN